MPRRAVGGGRRRHRPACGVDVVFWCGSPFAKSRITQPKTQTETTPLALRRCSRRGASASALVRPGGGLSRLATEAEAQGRGLGLGDGRVVSAGGSTRTSRFRREPVAPHLPQHWPRPLESPGNLADARAARCRLASGAPLGGARSPGSRGSRWAHVAQQGARLSAAWDAFAWGTMLASAAAAAAAASAGGGGVGGGRSKVRVGGGGWRGQGTALPPGLSCTLTRSLEKARGRARAPNRLLRQHCCAVLMGAGCLRPSGYSLACPLSPAASRPPTTAARQSARGGGGGAAGPRPPGPPGPPGPAAPRPWPARRSALPRQAERPAPPGGAPCPSRPPPSCQPGPPAVRLPLTQPSTPPPQRRRPASPTRPHP
jgi:hypothetical protein